MATPRVFLSWNTHPASHASPSRRRVGCDSWRLHWGIFFRELGHLIYVHSYHASLFCLFLFPSFLCLLCYYVISALIDCVTMLIRLVCFFLCYQPRAFMHVYPYCRHSCIEFVSSFCHGKSEGPHYLLKCMHGAPW